MTTSFLAPLIILLLIVTTVLYLRSLRVYPLESVRHLLLLRNRVRRQNHALEHATVNVVEERHGPSKLVGHALSDGFRISGPIEPLELLDAAHEALRRLKLGEHRLAIHNRCGISYLAAHLLVGLSVLALMLLIHPLTVLDIPVVVAVALLLTPTVSRLIQRFATTTTDVQGMVIEGIGPVHQYLCGNEPGYDLIVRTRRRVRRSYEYRYGQVAYAHAPVRTNHS